MAYQHETGYRSASGTARLAGMPRRRLTRPWWQAGLAALTTLAMLSASGCAAGKPGRPERPSHPPVASASSSAPPGVTAAVPDEVRGTGSRSGVVGGVLFGGNESLLPEQARLGRRLAIVRVYYRLGEPFPRPRDRRLMAQGSTVLVSLDVIPGDPGYAAIVAGHEDAVIRAFIDAVNGAAVRYHLPAVYLCFEHEVNALGTHQGLGSPGQFIRAWDHIHQLAAAAHADWNQGGRIHWVWILTHEAFSPLDHRPRWALDMGTAGAYWPGSKEVDIVAADGYDGTSCNPRPQASRALLGAATPESLFDPVISFARAHGGLPVFIAEWGGTAFPASQQQASFIKQMQAFVAASPEIAAVLYWNGPAVGRSCAFSIDPNPGSIAAMAAMAHAPVLQGRLTG